MKNIFSKYKIIFYGLNVVLIALYLYPGSLLGCFIFDNCKIQPKLTRDFIVSSNHVYTFGLITLIGFFTYIHTKKNKYLIIYLILISIFLEILHIIIPNRGFEFSDLFGNILGVLIVYFFYQIYNHFYNSKNENKKF